MIKIKNVRSGILIIADAGLKLAPGESRDLDELTPQAKRALAGGLLVQMDKEQETKSKVKSTSRGGNGADGKEPDKTEAAGTEAELTPAPGRDPDKTGEQPDPGKRRDTKPKQVVEAENGDK